MKGINENSGSYTAKTTTLKINTGWKFVTTVLALSLAGALSAGCSSESNNKPTVSEEGESAGSTPVHVAFAGGGWRAHTAHAGWTMSLLDDGAYTLDYAFENVETLSSNSGGTWFLNMLAYSDAFRSSIEAQGAYENYITAQGYLGQERALFDDFSATLVSSNWCPFSESEPAFYFYCRLASIAGGGGLIWTDIVNNVVFAPLGMDKELGASPTLLSDPRQTWAADKSLLVAATMLTDHAILTESSYILDKLYYDATLSGSGPEQVNVTPVTFASVQADKVSPPLLSAGEFELAYTDADFGDSVKTSFMNTSTTDNVPVLLATAASSAAVGAAASYNVLIENGYKTLTWELAYELSDLAVPFKLGPPVEGGKPNGLTTNELSDAKFARFADGGYQDNSAVAQLVSYLQANNEATDFQIVAFDNVQALYSPASGVTATDIPVGLDIALLFGEGGQNQICAGAGGEQFCVSVPAQQIFASDPLNSTGATWEWSAPNVAGSMLSYTRYDVTTVDNATLGLSAGTHGILHVFTCVWPTADTGPWNGASDFDAYEAMLAAIRTGLQANNNEGLDHLRAALAGSL